MRKDINWPRRWQSFGRSCSRTLGRKKEFSCTASEFLTVYPALRAYLHSLGLHEAGDQQVLRVVESFFAMTELLELLHSSMRKAIMWQESGCILFPSIVHKGCSEYLHVSIWHKCMQCCAL